MKEVLMSRILIATSRPTFGTAFARGTGASIAQMILTAPLAMLAAWGDRLKQRDALAEMDARMLKDIGVSRGEAMVEADKPFWTA